MAIWNLSGPLAGALSYRWSIRTITFGGVLLVTITNVICWFASDIYVVTFFLGGLQGLGVGMAVTLVPVIINQYFSKYKSTGAGIACAGATAGSFALPPIVEYAVEEYGLCGAFLMMAGITLHGILGAALLRPAHWLQPNNKKKKLKGDQNLNFLMSKSVEALDKDEVKSLLKNSKKTVCQENGSKSIKTVRFVCDQEKIPKNDPENEETSLLENTVHPIIVSSNKETPNGIEISRGSNGVGHFDTGSRTVVMNSDYTHILEPLSSKNSDLEEDQNESFSSGKLHFKVVEEEYDPQINLAPVHLTRTVSEHESETEPLPNMVYCPTTEPTPPSSWLDSVLVPVKAACEIVKNPMFLIIASNYSVFFLSYMTYLIVIVDYSLDLGVDRTDSVFLISTFSVADLCGRLGSGWITDSGIVKRKHLMMVNMVTVGGLLVATSFTTTYMAVTAVSVCAGLIVGINLILFYALLEEYLGLKQLPMAVGLMNFSIGVISFVTPILTGYFRDTMGSYDHLFHFLGGVSIFCGLLWILEPMHAACNKKTVAFEKTSPC
ncbi:monocarboxylate transporter 12-like [Uloborus diversus]|uniref:monocarboxylate transporter 12-like n=1 Tax=Uloborus diversus TaxID=327109 RepID=UPI0024090E96|nr:monocarboxylate transporter 12-like [Uloborus diversus]